MKGRITKSIAKLMCLTVCAGCVATPLMACGHPEKALILATDALDGVFNPFFYTSGADGEIVSQTQIGMLSSDKNGKPVASWTEPSVAFDYSIVKNGDKSMVQGNNYGEYWTDYYFALKDNIKFSDGTSLTKDDVLFNIYMYLDPAYTGSSTMYSVNIKGLTEYRTQTNDLDQADGANEVFNNAVTARLQSILGWTEEDESTWNDLDEYATQYGDADTIRSDIAKIQDYFKQSLNESWTSALSVETRKDAAGKTYITEYEKYKDQSGNYILTEPWQVFLYNYGVIQWQEHRDQQGAIDYYIVTQNVPSTINVPATAEARAAEAFRDVLVNYVYSGEFDANEQANATESYKTNLRSIMVSYPVNYYMEEYLLSDVKHRMFQDNLQVKNISGITVTRMSSIPTQTERTDASGNRVYDNSTKALLDSNNNPGEYDVLKIRINGVDPKAIQNFSFTVAPGHYYSDAETWKKAIDDTDDDEFFGVKFSDPTFMDTIRVKQLPLGAGPFRAAKSNGGVAQSKSDFLGSNNIVNFESNPYFLLGEPKINKLRYKVVSNSQLYSAVTTGDVHYASPSMKRDDITALHQDNKLESEFADNLGYGYIGISARYIPNIYIRQAIMTTFDANTCIESYYGSNGASVITIPMSKTLDNYYTAAAPAQPRYTFDESGDAARELLEAGGCTQDSNGVWYDEKGKRMKYTFTIAGDSDDHPAQQLLLQSKNILDRLGLEITITHDSTALSKLSSGLLTVWAAAWSSSSDPDMYQVYHKDSQATSTLAWGYRYIFSSEFTELSAANNGYGYKGQRQMINELSDLIDDGRETDVVEEREEIYKNAMAQLMELAVEFPTYQRSVYYVWRKGVFNESTLQRGTGNVTTYQSPLSRIWEVELA